MGMLARTVYVGIGLIGATAPAFAAGDGPIASDGRAHMARSAASDRSAPSLGAATVSRSNLEATGVSFQAQPLAAANGLATVAYGDKTEARAGRSLIGWDSRMRINPVGYPNRAIVYITRNGSHHCTGWMISANTLVTAGHCVHPGGSASSFYAPSSFRVYPGYDGTGAGTYGSCTVLRTHSVTGWTSSGNSDYDYGAMRLNCTVGNTVGWFGYWSPTQSTLLGQPMVTAGYPGDKPRTQWTSSDKLRAVSNFKVSYRADTIGGQSGSPVWNSGADATFTNGAWAFAIHAYGVSGACASNTNCAPWLRAPVVTNLNTWRTAP
jgi:glutamyl endopeptidase